MERIEEIRTHPMLEDIRNNLKMRGIFISERNVYSYEDEIRELEERKVEPQLFLDYMIEEDLFNEELKSIEEAKKALNNLNNLDKDLTEVFQTVLDEHIAIHNTTIRHKARSEATIAVADKDIAILKEEKMLALNVSDDDILDFLSIFR